MLRQAYGIPSSIDNRRQPQGLSSQGQTIDQPTQCQVIATQEVQTPPQDALVHGQVPPQKVGPVVQSPTATAFQEPMLQRGIEAPITSQASIRAQAEPVPPTTMYVTRRLPRAGYRTTRYPSDSQGDLTQRASQVQQVPVSGTLHPSTEQMIGNQNVVEICRNEDQRVQERLFNRIEQAVLQLTTDLRTQSNRSNAVAKRLNDVLNTLSQATTDEMPKMLYATFVNFVVTSMHL